MTSAEAAQILQKPVFGNQICIDALTVLQMAEELQLARKWAKREGLSGKFSSPFFGHIDTTTPIASMEDDRIGNEINYWCQCGWEKA